MDHRIKAKMIKVLEVNIYEYFLKFCLTFNDVYVCGYVHVNVVAMDAWGLEFHRTGIKDTIEPPDMHAGNWTCVSWKNSTCSQLQHHLTSPKRALL